MLARLRQLATVARSVVASPLGVHASLYQHSRYSTAKIDKPSLHLSFTCKACSHRSGHIISKQGYEHGTVLVQCPQCKNRHLIADHLNVFGQGKKSLTDILSEHGSEQITQGTIDPSKVGDIVWEETEHPQLQIESK